jgi:hypothetical protein
MQVIRYKTERRSSGKKHQGPFGAPHCSPRRSLGAVLEFEHVMLGPEKRRAMLE